MAKSQIPDDLATSQEEVVALAYWRGHMDARMDDLSRRVSSIDEKVNNIHEVVQKIASDMNAKDATEKQAKSAIRWLLPDATVAIAVGLGILAIALRFIP